MLSPLCLIAADHRRGSPNRPRPSPGGSIPGTPGLPDTAGSLRPGCEKAAPPLTLPPICFSQYYKSAVQSYVLPA